MIVPPLTMVVAGEGVRVLTDKLRQQFIRYSSPRVAVFQPLQPSLAVPEVVLCMIHIASHPASREDQQDTEVETFHCVHTGVNALDFDPIIRQISHMIKFETLK